MVWMPLENENLTRIRHAYKMGRIKIREGRRYIARRYCLASAHPLKSQGVWRKNEVSENVVTDIVGKTNRFRLCSRHVSRHEKLR